MTPGVRVWAQTRANATTRPLFTGRAVRRGQILQSEVQFLRFYLMHLLDYVNPNKALDEKVDLLCAALSVLCRFPGL